MNHCILCLLITSQGYIDSYFESLTRKEFLLRKFIGFTLTATNLIDEIVVAGGGSPTSFPNNSALTL